METAMAPLEKLPGDGVTISDVAARAAVSIRTVSRVLNRSTKVNSATQGRVERAIAELNFSPSARARGLATGRSYLLGVVHNDRNALVIDPVQRGVVEESARRGYEMVVHPASSEGAEVVQAVLDFVRRSRVDGLIVLPPVSGTPGLGMALTKAGVPCVALSSIDLPHFASLIVSREREAAADVARFLLDTGHRRIALISGPQSVNSARERRAGFIDAIQTAGLEIEAEAEGDYGFDSGVRAAHAVLTARPTAIFAANDIMAAGVLKVAAMCGIAVPRDLSVVGFDGSLLARMLTPALTSVYRPIGDMARQATTCLIDVIEGKQVQQHWLVQLEMAHADSVGTPSH